LISFSHQWQRSSLW